MTWYLIEVICYLAAVTYHAVAKSNDIILDLHDIIYSSGFFLQKFICPLPG